MWKHNKYTVTVLGVNIFYDTHMLPHGFLLFTWSQMISKHFKGFINTINMAFYVPWMPNRDGDK